MSYPYDAKQNEAISHYWFAEGFSSEELKLIEDGVAVLPYMRGTVHSKNAHDRKSNIKWIPNHSEWDWLYYTLMRFADIANEEMWKFDLKSAGELIQYTEYDSDELGKYDWHQDIGLGDTSSRKISITVQLSDSNEYEGGDLCFWQGGPSLEENNIIAPRGKGNVVLFPSYIVHSVKPVTKGTRKSFVLWLGGGHYK